MAISNKSLTGRSGGLGLFAAVALLVFSCTNQPGESTGGETHFLTHCTASTGSCGNQLSCLCGVCTLPCNERAACQALPAAECVPPRQGAACADSPAPGQCDVQCLVDADCAVLSALHHCEQGACRAAAPDLGGSGGAGDAGDAGASGMGECAHGQVSANQVLLIGDSFFATSHQIAAYLEGDARNAGVLPTGERYRDNSNLTSNALAWGGNGIAGQYDAAVSEAAVKVVIMNGGGADVLLGPCDTADANCPVLVAATAAAQSLLAKMAQDGVEHVVYVFYADPVDDASSVAELDALRPLIQHVCESSPVPCAWLDLRPVFAGHYAEYVQADGRDPTAAGSQASAAAIWAILQQSCIAQ